VKGAKNMKEQLEAIRSLALEELSKVNEKTELENIRVKYLGKKGELTTILRGMGKLTAEERPLVGKIANEVREAVENEITKKNDEIKSKEKEEKLKSEIIDISMPGKKQVVGKRHPLI
jgi:phenylalanyl-tRNA synthetase alpha chain